MSSRTSVEPAWAKTATKIGRSTYNIRPSMSTTTSLKPLGHTFLDGGGVCSQYKWSSLLPVTWELYGQLFLLRAILENRMMLSLDGKSNGGFSLSSLPLHVVFFAVVFKRKSM